MGPTQMGRMREPGGDRRIGVLVVDDDDINRHGMTALLGSQERIAVVAALSHAEALTWDGHWSAVDLALVDAADERAQHDQFPGVSVVERIRRRAGERITVVVVTGHFFDDAVRRRMWEAHADFFYHRSEVGDVRVLHQVVLDPEQGRRIPGPRDPEEQFRLGVTDATRVNRAVRHAVGMDLAATLVDRSQPRSRRWLRLRRDFNRQALLTPRTAEGHVPDRLPDLPSLPQIGRFLAWATRSKAHPGAELDDPPTCDGEPR